MRYIGSKLKLKDYILTTVQKYCGEDLSDKTFCDLFAGTGVVGKTFSPYVKSVIANDLEYYSYIANYSNLKGFNREEVSKILDMCNKIEPIYEGPLFDGYADTGKYERQYFTRENGGKIEAARRYLESIKDTISKETYCAILYSIVDGSDKVANTCSTYGAFIKGFDKHKASLEPVVFELPEIVKGNHENNICYQGDANEVIKEIKGDIEYLDPPYNSRQYGGYYHVLNGIAKYSVPETESKTGVCKNAYNKSNYSIEKKALDSLDNLLANSNFEWIFMSYNNEGIIPIEDIKATMEKYGSYSVETQDYKRYKADNKRDYTADKVIEYIHVLHKGHFNDKKIEPVYLQLELFTEEEMSGKTEETTAEVIAPAKDIIVSPMNYMGGKRKLIKSLLPLFPSQCNTFVDLFCGGCTVGINATAKNIIFNDQITKMVDLYKAFQTTSVEDILTHIDNRISEFNLSLTNLDGYTALKDLYNQEQNPLDLFVLVSYGFNHQVRFNGKGEYNIPFGKDRSQYNDTIKKHLVEFVERIQSENISFMSTDFRNYPFDTLKPGDMVYCDPPYLISTATYNDGWTETEEKELLAILSDLNKRGIRFALSNVLENKGKVNTILKDWAESNYFNVHHLEMKYSNSSYHRKERNDKSDEVLITNY